MVGRIDVRPIRLRSARYQVPPLATEADVVQSQHRREQKSKRMPSDWPELQTELGHCPIKSGLVDRCRDAIWEGILRHKSLALPSQKTQTHTQRERELGLSCYYNLYLRHSVSFPSNNLAIVFIERWIDQFANWFKEAILVLLYGIPRT